VARTKVSSLGLPIVIGSITVLVTILMLVAWIWVIVDNLAATREVARNTTLLVTGLVSLLVILSLVVTLSIFLGREILEVHRQNTFIDSVTHELKSPLASLKLCLETQLRPELSVSQRTELRDMMLADIDRLSVFIDDILEASRIVHGRRGFHLEEVDVQQLVQRCVDSIVRRYKLEPEELRSDAQPGITMTSDGVALETAVKNLLDNAVKYSDPPVRVELTAVANDGALEVVVRDHGIGIPKQHLRRIFDRFYRVPGDRVNARRGTGLGLYVVAQLVRSLGGTLSASSEGDGQGTTMRLTVPLDPAGARPEPHEVRSERPA
jgi:signal transduction histidine kinase